MLTSARRVLAGTIAGLVLVPVAQASAAPHLIVWSGDLAPGGTAQGVELLADGTGHRVAASPSGAIVPAGSFSPTGARLAAIRLAAGRLLASGPSVTHAETLDGGYVSVLLEEGTRRRAVVDSGQDSAAVLRLLEALNAALPASSRLAGAGPSAAGAGTAVPRVAPDTAPCPDGQQATEVVKQVPMAQAAAAKLVTLSAKGAFGGDSVAVDATWKPVVAPATITLHLEFTAPPGSTDDFAYMVRDALQQRYSGYRVDGQPVSFVFDTVNRAPGAAPRPCYHQIAMTPGVRDYVDGLTGVRAGEWNPDDPSGFAHETGHLLGLPDAYRDAFRIDRTGAEVRLPQNGLEGDALQAALPARIRVADGHLISKPFRGHAHELMADVHGRLRQADLARLVSRADIDVVDAPGDVLLNKNAANQNLVTAAPFRLRVPRGGKAHVDGLVAYCIDLHRHVPERASDLFDVLGPAGAQGIAAYAALQRVVDVVAARQSGPLEEVLGANDAIWRVTDDEPVTSFDPYAAALLAAAGVPAGPGGPPFAAPHLDNPAAATPGTAAITLATGVVPEPAPPVEGAPDPSTPPASVLSALSLPTRVIRAPAGSPRAVVSARVTVDGAPARLTLALTRVVRGRRLTVARIPSQTVEVGDDLLSLVTRRLPAGAYTVEVRQTGGRVLRASIRVARAAPGPIAASRRRAS